jgi:hypothetical protein
MDPAFGHLVIKMSGHPPFGAQVILAQMEDLFDRILDRTRSRLDIPAIRTLFGLKTRPHRTRKAGPPAQEIVIEKPRYGLSWFRISFGRSQLKA